MDSLEILYDHYKETCELSREAQNRRNKSFIGLCVLEALSFLVLIRPMDVLELFKSELKSKLDVTLNFGSNILQTLIWVSITYVMIRYVQDMLYIERQYTYMDTLEKEISEKGSVGVFNREGLHYRENYPMVLNLIDLFYKMLSPVLFLTINTIKIASEWKQLNSLTLALACDTVLYGSLSLILWFYFFEIHSKITSWFKKHIKIIDNIASTLRKWFKEV